MASIKDKRNGLTKEVKVKFGGYPTGKKHALKNRFLETDLMIFFLLLIVQFRNGAYLFKPDHNRDPVSVIDPIDHLKEVVVISGHVFSEISLIYEAGNFAKYRLGNIKRKKVVHSKFTILQKKEAFWGWIYFVKNYSYNT